jgi:hypothetical protein
LNEREYERLKRLLSVVVGCEVISSKNMRFLLSFYASAEAARVKAEKRAIWFAGREEKRDREEAESGLRELQDKLSVISMRDRVSRA